MEKFNTFDELKPLQKKQLEMLVDLKAFCEEHEIIWTLAFGSVLGAKRHGGPIPWDDDVDIQMQASEYKKFKECFQKYGNHEKYYLQELQACDEMISSAKIRLNHSAYIEDVYQKFDIHQGIFIDIFLIHDAAPHKWGRIKGNFAQIYLDMKDLSNRGYTKRKSAAVLMGFLRLFPRQFCYGWAFRQMYKWDGTDQNTLVIPDDWQIKDKQYLAKESMLPPSYIPYDGIMMPVPRDTERYLENCYGDWRKIPDLKSIQWTQHAKKWSITEDFRTFCPNIDSFKDEGTF